MQSRFSWVLAPVLLVAASAPHADTRAHEKQELARFSHYAGAPMDEFTMFDMWQWQVLGPTQLVVWSTINDAYLIRVDKGCNNLEWTRALSLTQEMRTKVTQKFDYVVVRGQCCKIEEIRPVDYRRMVKEGASQPPAHEGETQRKE